MARFKMPRERHMRSGFTRLGDIAEVRNGFTFREKITEVPAGTGTAHIVQIKDARKVAEETGRTELTPDQLPEITWKGKLNAFVPAGAVILPSRGGYFKASLLTDHCESRLPVVVSSQFLILYGFTGLLPEFLCWSLNQPSIQRYLKEGAGSQGTNITMLSRKNVQSLEIQIPNLTAQKKILTLNKLWEEEQRLSKALLDNREVMMQGMFQEILKDNKE